MDTEAILKRLDTIQEIQTLPEVYMRINQMLDDPVLSAAGLGQVVEQDAALVMKLLRLVNSAFYGLRNRVGTISEAIVILGFNTVRNAILSMSVFMTLSRNRSDTQNHATALWRHALAVAVTTRHLGQRTRREKPENGFVSGLLHDMGKVVLLQYFGDLFAQIMATMQADGQGFLEVEKRCLPLQHPAIGAHLANKWHLPAPLVEAIRWHHGPPTLKQNNPLLCLTAAADQIVNRHLPQFGLSVPNSAPCDGWPDWLRADITASESWFFELMGEIEAAWDFFLKVNGH
jgi:HD-like signal output (HDOD) protein